MTDHIVDANKLVRAEFEAWAHKSPANLAKDAAGGYQSATVAFAWRAVQAATQRQQERISYVEKVADDAIELGNQQAIRIAELEAQVQALSLDAFAKDASIGHLSRLVDAERSDAARYQWLRERDLETISHGGVFAGKTPDNVILNGEELDRAIDAAIDAGKGGQE